MKLNHAKIAWLSSYSKKDPAKSPFRNAGAFMWIAFHFFPRLFFFFFLKQSLMAFIDEYQLVWPQKSYLGSVLECCPLNFIFPDKIDGALKDLSLFLAASFSVSCFAVLLGLFIQRAHFAFIPLVPLFQRAWFIFWILQCFVDYMLFIIWMMAILYEKVNTFCFHLSATV